MSPRSHRSQKNESNNIEFRYWLKVDAVNKKPTKRSINN
jgi:hypothetical protein